MKHTSLWSDILRQEGSLKQLLVTISFVRETVDIAINTGQHIATIPGSFRTSDKGAVVRDGTYPYYFTSGLIEWPDLTESINPRTRELSGIKATLQLHPDAGFPVAFLQPGGTHSAVLRIDLWSPGMQLSVASRLFQGQVEGARYLSQSNVIEVTAVDGDPARQVSFPPGDNSLDRSTFPDIIDNVSGVYRRQVILGPFPYPILCPQVDKAGYLFYLCDHKLTAGPTVVYDSRGDVIPTEQWGTSTVNANTSLFGTLDGTDVITLIRLNKSRLSQEIPTISCAGGVGLPSHKTPPLLLLEDYGRYKVKQEAREIFQEADFQFSTLITAKGPVLGIVKDRLIPQTNYVMGFRGGEITLIPLEGKRREFILSIGNGLLGRTTRDVEDTDPGEIFNSIEIEYERNVFSTNEIDSSRRVYVLNEINAKGDLRNKLLLSQRTYGRRHLSMAFPDTISMSGGDEGIVPENVISASKLILSLTALQGQVYEYLASWYPTALIDLNDIFRVNHPEEGLVNSWVRLVSKSIEPNGYTIKVEKEQLTQL